MNKKILSILGDYYHDHDIAFTALKKAVDMLNKSGLHTFELIDSDVDGLEEALSQKYDLVILGKENRINPTDEVVNKWMTRDIEKKIVDYVNNGGSWMAWHAGLALYDETGEYTKMMGGYFLSHPNEHRIVKYIPKENSSGISLKESFEAMDEHYFVKYNLDKSLVFLDSESSYGESEAGWAREFGAGRICCLAPTHREEGLTNKVMIETLRDCISWCCKL
ncbi:ThuA domain-containing protein [Ruminiclostridium josui]|uniref:ThuA domain-containing protein n=1 Tax=Ruminiclostridium josui TaxID=1499 RepID=UPI00046650CF|nr:ThuA domain-containing protein [Ruminiclostridium josui]